MTLRDFSGRARNDGMSFRCAMRCRRAFARIAIELATMILLTAAESRELDRLSQTKYGVDSYALMTRAGEAVADKLIARFSDAARAGVLAICGKGNNGGDAMVAARRLGQRGVQVRVALLGSSRDLKGDALRAHDELLAAGGAIVQAQDEAELEAAFGARPGAIVDGIFGTGLNAPVRGVARAAIERMNAIGAPIVAVDIASGVDSDSGAIMGAAVRAALTVTFGYREVRTRFLSRRGALRRARDRGDRIRGRGDPRDRAARAVLSNRRRARSSEAARGRCEQGKFRASDHYRRQPRKIRRSDPRVARRAAHWSRTGDGGNSRIDSSDRRRRAGGVDDRSDRRTRGTLCGHRGVGDTGASDRGQERDRFRSRRGNE